MFTPENGWDSNHKLGVCILGVMIAPIYKPFGPFVRGPTNLLRGQQRSPWLLTAYKSWDDPPSSLQGVMINQTTKPPTKQDHHRIPLNPGLINRDP